MGFRHGAYNALRRIGGRESANTFPFLELPAELRLQIYDLLTVRTDGPVGTPSGVEDKCCSQNGELPSQFHVAAGCMNERHHQDQVIRNINAFMNLDFALSCKTIYNELLTRFYEENDFEFHDLRTCQRFIRHVLVKGYQRQRRNITINFVPWEIVWYSFGLQRFSDIFAAFMQFPQLGELDFDIKDRWEYDRESLLLVLRNLSSAPAYKMLSSGKEPFITCRFTQVASYLREEGTSTAPVHTTPIYNEVAGPLHDCKTIVTSAKDYEFDWYCAWFSTQIAATKTATARDLGILDKSRFTSEGFGRITRLRERETEERENPHLKTTTSTRRRSSRLRRLSWRISQS